MTRGSQRSGTENTWRGKAKGIFKCKEGKTEKKIRAHITHGYPTGTWI